MKSCISEIRELINKRILNSLLSKDVEKWNLICGSIDAIESAQLAIDSYNCLKDEVKDVGEYHLIIYGLFQAIYIQQDSVLNLCSSMNIDFKIKDFETQHPELFEIRQLRNKGIGHPSKEGKGKIKSIHSMLIDNNSIELFSYTETGEFNHAEYKISECIEKQNKTLCKILQNVIKKMRAIEKEHKDKYKRNKLRGCFPRDPQYCFEKIFQAINLINAHKETVPKKFESVISFALSNTEDLIEGIDRFGKEVRERGLQDDDITSVRLEIKHSKYPLEKLKEYFFPGSKSSLNSQDARAYADSAREHTLDLIKYVENLDNEYMSTA